MMGASFPLIVFLAGGLVDKSLYSNFATLLASYGYVVVIPNHLQSMVPNMPPNFWASQHTPSDVLLDVAFRSQQDSTSPLFGLVDTNRVGLSGHSNGGAAALFASSSHCQFPFCVGRPTFERPDEFRAAVVISTHLVPMGGESPPPPSAAVGAEEEASTSHHQQEQGPPPFSSPIMMDMSKPINVDNEIPIALINGQLDSMEDVCESWPLIEEEKDLIILEGANHWAVTNIQNPPGNTPDPNNQTVTQTWSNEMCAKWTARIFDVYLKQDELFFDTPNPNEVDEGVLINQHCQDGVQEDMVAPTSYPSSPIVKVHESSDDVESDVDAGKIAGAVIGCFIALVVLGFGAYLLHLKVSSGQSIDSKPRPDPSSTAIEKHEDTHNNNPDPNIIDIDV